MKVVSIQSKDIYVTIDLSITEIDKLLTALSCAKLEYDGQENPDIREAADYLTKEFYPALDDLHRGILGGNTDVS